MENSVIKHLTTGPAHTYTQASYIQEPLKLLRTPPYCNIMKVDNQEKYAQVHVLQSKVKA